jgi:multiple sugar transport system permease protein
MSKQVLIREPAIVVDSDRQGIRVNIRSIIKYILVTFLAFLMAMPFIWMLSTSLKTDIEALRFPPQMIPSTTLWENYPRAWNSQPFDRAYFNSIYIAVVVTVVQTLTCALAAYAFARIKFVGRNIIFMAFLATLMVPFQVTLVPRFLMFRDLGWINTHLPLIVPSALANAFSIFLIRQFIMSLPIELEEAAEIDGASRIRIFMQIILPLTKPALAATAIFAFLGQWNSLLAPLIFLSSPELFTVPLLLNSFRGLYTTSWPLVMAASVISVVPVLIVYAAFQKYFIQGITLSGLKG